MYYLKKRAGIEENTGCGAPTSYSSMSPLLQNFKKVYNVKNVLG